MVLRIRLARFGTKHSPVYNIVVAQAKSARDKRPMEVLGTYNPIPQTPVASADTPEFLANGEKFVPKRFKDIRLDSSRTKYWLGVGAQPTEPVAKLLCLVSFCSWRIITAFLREVSKCFLPVVRLSERKIYQPAQFGTM